MNWDKTTDRAREAFIGIFGEEPDADGPVWKGFENGYFAASAPNPSAEPVAKPQTDAEALYEAWQATFDHMDAKNAAPIATPSDKQESQFADVIGEGFDDWFQSQKGIAYGSAYASAKAAWNYQEKHIDMMAEHLKSCLDRIEELQLLANPSDKQEAVCEHEWEAMTEPHKECVKCGEVRRDWTPGPIVMHYAAPLAQSAEQDRIDAERWRMAVALCYMPQAWREHIDTEIAKGASK